MKTAIVGGGRGCRSLLVFILEGGLTELQLDVRLVCDPVEDAPGLVFAKQWGIPTCTRVEDVLEMPGLEVVVELTGKSDVSDEIYHRLPPGVRVIDHRLARLFWDMIHAERHLRDERDRAQKILDSMPDIVLVVNRERRIETVNAAFSRFTGLSRREARGLACHDALCALSDLPSAEMHSCPFDQVVESGRRRNLVQVRAVRGGEEEHFEVNMTPIKDANGEVVQVVEALHPIGERVKLRMEVEAFAERFRQFIDSAHDLISIKGLDGRYQVVNEATANFIGIPIDECIGRKIEDLAPEETWATVVSHDAEVIEKREAISYEETFPFRGEEHHFNTVRFPLLDPWGDVVGVCTISRDVTREKRLQRELIHADKLASLGKLAAGVAHEINNPLTGILSFAEDLLEDAAEGDPRREDYEVIIRETLRCRGIVKNLLDFSKQRQPRFRRVDLNRVAERALALVERLVTFRDVEVRRNLPEDLPAISGDGQQLQQVVLNLLVNAADSMPDGGPVDVATGVTADGTHCHLTVADRGTGIDESQRDKLFEPFFSTKKTTQGLGLAVSWGIVDRHGGRIEAGNREGGGAEFRIILPRTGGEE